MYLRFHCAHETGVSVWYNMVIILTNIETQESKSWLYYSANITRFMNTIYKSEIPIQTHSKIVATEKRKNNIFLSKYCE